MTERVTSRHNPAVSHLVKLLSQRKYRRMNGEFAAEGTKLLFDAIAGGADVHTVFQAEGSDIPALPVGIRHIQLPERLFESVSTQKSPQGVIFTAGIPVPPDLPKDGRFVVLDGVQDPGNLGTVMRTAAAMGLDGVFLCGGCADAFSYKTVRASMGAVFRVPAYEYSIDELGSFLAERDLTLLAGMPAGESLDVRCVDWSTNVAVVGSEGQGVSNGILKLAGGSFRIPMAAGTESLNAAVAAAIIMWEMSKKR